MYNSKVAGLIHALHKIAAVHSETYSRQVAQEALDAYGSKQGFKEIGITAKELGKALSEAHTHAELLLSDKFLQEGDNEDFERVLENPSEVVYREENLIEALVSIGLPKPDFNWMDGKPKRDDDPYGMGEEA